MTDGLDNLAFDRLLFCMTVLATLAAIAVMLWPMDDRPRFRRWRR